MACSVCVYVCVAVVSSRINALSCLNNAHNKYAGFPITTCAHSKNRTDSSGYTGAHKHRFDSSGRGRGTAGRDRVVKGGGYAASSGAYAGRSGFRGNTNTGTDETIHDISQVLMRK